MIPTPHTELIVAAGTHPGETGKNNEDRYTVQHYYGGPGEPVTLALVADGIGGNRAGEVAAQLVVETIEKVMGRASGADYAALLDDALRQAAQAVVAAGEERLQLRGMGSTCAAALIAGRRLYTAYIGDSRIYVLRRGSLIQTTVDHTFVQEAIEAGLLTPAEAKDNPHRHVVRRHIGADPNVKADFRLRLAEGEAPEHMMRNQGVLLEPGSQVLLCTDGLSDLVELAELQHALAVQAPRSAVDALIRLARARGGYDNITVIVVQL
jgi:protein phosphatase